MRFIEINSNSIQLLDRFLNNISEGKKSFRYFNNRTYNALNNHLLSIMLIHNEIPIGYGHLDKEKNKVWLGIAIADKYKSKGYGKIIMNELILNAKSIDLSEIYLSVDNSNIYAIRLYNKFGFKKLISDKSKTIFILKL